MMKFTTILAASLATTALACEFDNCDNVDNGSCGDACCKLHFLIEGESTTSVMNKLNSSIEMKGPDGLYTGMMTAEGTMTFGDLRPFDKPVDFIGQAWHMTADRKYNDTVNFLLKSVPGKEGTTSTVVTGFSISQIAGAYSDEGQNYYNLVSLVDSVNWDHQYTLQHADGSCPAPASK